MAPRPFPHLFHVGIDICKTERVLSILRNGSNNNAYQSFTRRLLTVRERDHVQARFGIDVQSEHALPTNLVNFLAGRWAAKEACIKAVKPRKLTLHQVEIWPDEYHETFAIILDKSTESNAAGESTGNDETGHETRAMSNKDQPLVPSHDSVQGQVARVSISHEDDYAVAVALAPTTPTPGDVGGEATAREIGS